MIYHLLPIPFHLILVALYLQARRKNDLKKTAIIQPLVTFTALLISGLSLFNPNSNPSYTIFIMIGMGLCVLADIFNIDMSNDKILFAAILVFLFAYLEYGITFTHFNGFHRYDLLIGAVMLLIYVLVMKLYWKGLAIFKLPIAIYMLVICFMVTKAISTLFGTTFSPISAWMVSVGGILLFLGDVEYGIHRFYKPVRFSLGPIFYALGQLLVALSCSYILF